MSKTTIERVEAQLSNPINEKKITNLLDTMERTSALPKQLQDKLNSIGNTPIDEPQLYELIKKSDEEGQAIIALHLLSESEIQEFSAVDIGNFIYAVKRHVVDLTLPDGVFKTTPNTVECKLPSFIQGDNLQRMARKQQRFLDGIKPTATDKEQEKIVKEFTTMVTTFNNEALSISGLDIESLSDWEKDLVISQIVASATNAFSCATGKGLGI